MSSLQTKSAIDLLKTLIFPSRQNTKSGSIQDDFLHENIPTLEWSQESDSTFKGIKISCSWNGVFGK